MGELQLSVEQQNLISKVLKMLGREDDDYDKLSVGENGEILITKGKPNIERFLKKVMDY